MSFTGHAAAKWPGTTMDPARKSSQQHQSLIPTWPSPTDISITADLHSDSFNPITLIGSPEEHVWDAFTNLHSEQSTPPGAVNPEGFLPSFIKPLPVIMNQDTIECLHINGTFALPNVPLQDALLQAFAECVLPSMPIVEWQPLVQALHGAHGSHGSISLLLYHAIMVSAATFVDIHYILDAGYTTRQEAQESFFQKARVSLKKHIQKPNPY